jgi:transposase-like protein
MRLMDYSRFTADQRRDFVLEYLAVPWGQRRQWRVARGMSVDVLYKWRRQVMAGVVESGRIPRGGVLVSVEENRELARLHAENKRLRAELDEARKSAESSARVVDALGKAIELLRDGTAPKGGDETGSRS